jgi:hypothetical protein
MDAVAYCTREEVKSSLESAETARNNAQIDRLILAASRSIEGLTHRFFYPWTGTRYFDWPNDQFAMSGRLWLDQHEVVSVTTLISGGTAIGSGDYFLEPSSSGPPFSHVDIDLSSSASFDAGDTYQRSIEITGVFYWEDEVTAGSLAQALDDSETTVDVSDSAAVGVGSIIKVDSERMIVTEKQSATTGQTLQSDMTASMADVIVAVTTGSSYNVGEVILLDAERMLIVDIAGNNLIVKRAWDGSVLATHSGSTIYAPRTLVVTRGALGTTAANHSDSTAITKTRIPWLINQLAIAETLTAFQQESSAYARVVGSGEGQREAAGKGLADLREQVYTRYGRKVRARAV